MVMLHPVALGINVAASCFVQISPADGRRAKPPPGNRRRSSAAVPTPDERSLGPTLLGPAVDDGAAPGAGSGGAVDDEAAPGPGSGGAVDDEAASEFGTAAAAVGGVVDGRFVRPVLRARSSTSLLSSSSTAAHR